MIETRASRRRSAALVQAEPQAILPGLPSDIAMRILARLPRSLHASLSIVSRAWCFALDPRVITPLRDALHISEYWLAFSFQANKNSAPFALYDPILGRFCCSPFPCYPAPFDKNCCTQLFGVLGSHLLFRTDLVIAGRRYAYVESLDIALMKISLLLEPFPSEMVSFFVHSAMPSNNVYVVGIEHIWRFDLEKNLLQMLPNTHVQRIDPLFVVLEGKLCVISDRAQETFSGETWDPKGENHWTLVPELWPRHIFDGAMTSQLPQLAVLADTLYVIKQGKMVRPSLKLELVCYDTSTKSWKSLGFLPAIRRRCKICDEEDGCFQLLVAGDELWVLVIEHDQHPEVHSKDWRVTLLSCVPSRHKRLAWKTSYFSIPAEFPLFFLFPVKV